MLLKQVGFLEHQLCMLLHYIPLLFGYGYGTPNKSSNTAKSITNVNKMSPELQKSATKYHIGVSKDSFEVLIAIL